MIIVALLLLAGWCLLGGDRWKCTLSLILFFAGAGIIYDSITSVL